jgi:6-pyruvoyltetrahydropterin/6-carboxytetrahydropterin synthase
MQYITRSGTFDSGHRVMNECMKCFNLHGHTYLYDLTFSFDSMKDIGYQIDFKEIKRVACQWIDDKLDHGFIANPEDVNYISVALNEDSKVWKMSLNGEGEYCNPSVENIVKEIFLAMEILFEEYTDLNIHEIKLNETPKCYTICKSESISDDDRSNFRDVRYEEIKNYANEKGIVEYDDRLQ